MTAFSSVAEPSLFVIFGGTGDLARRKLLPAIARLVKDGRVPAETHVLAVATDAHSNDDAYREVAARALAEAGLAEEDTRELLGRLHYQTIGKADAHDFEALAQRLYQLETAHGLPGNRAFYLALPPQAFVGLAGNLRLIAE